MKNQQAQLQKRLREETEKKKYLEAEIQQGQQEIKARYFISEYPPNKVVVITGFFLFAMGCNFWN